MDTKEKPTTPADKFLQSKEYLDLQKEIKESVAEALANEEGEDIEPVMRLFDQKMADYQSDAVLREKMFWETVAVALRKSFFDNISTKIVLLVEGGAYAEIEQALNKELSLVIQKLSPTVYKNLTKRGFAITVLKKYFLSLMPEVSALIGAEAEGKKPVVKIPGGKFIEREEQDSVKRTLNRWAEKADRERPPKYPRYAKEKTWPAPKLEEIKPGLIIEWENREFEFKGSFEVLDLPYQNESGSWRVKAKIISGELAQPGTIKEEFLQDLGMMPYGKNKWNNWYRPIRWYMKKEKFEK